MGQDVAAVKDDLVGPGAAGGLAAQGNAAEQPQERVAVGETHFTTDHFVGSVLDDDGHLVKIDAKLRGDGIDGVADNAIKFVVGDVQLKVSAKLSEFMWPQFKDSKETAHVKC